MMCVICVTASCTTQKIAYRERFEDAKGYEGSVLILRGTKDELVDDKTCETYMECYTGAKKFVKIEGGNHNFASIPAREACEAEIVNYVKEII